MQDLFRPVEGRRHEEVLACGKLGHSVKGPSKKGTQGDVSAKSYADDDVAICCLFLNCLNSDHVYHSKDVKEPRRVRRPGSGFTAHVEDACASDPGPRDCPHRRGSGGEAGRRVLLFWRAGSLGAQPWRRSTQAPKEYLLEKVADQCTTPPGPTPQQRGDHEAAGHIRYHAWCTSCVAGRGRSDRHQIHLGATGSVELLALDYACLRGRVAECEGPLPPPILTTRRAQSKAAAVDMVSIKGAAHPWPIGALLEAILAARSLPSSCGPTSRPSSTSSARQPPSAG